MSLKGTTWNIPLINGWMKWSMVNEMYIQHNLGQEALKQKNVLPKKKKTVGIGVSQYVKISLKIHCYVTL